MLIWQDAVRFHKVARRGAIEDQRAIKEDLVTEGGDNQTSSLEADTSYVGCR